MFECFHWLIHCLSLCRRPADLQALTNGVVGARVSDYFRLDQMISAFNFASEHEIEKNQRYARDLSGTGRVLGGTTRHDMSPLLFSPLLYCTELEHCASTGTRRFRLLQLRDSEAPDFRGFRCVPITEKEVRPEVFEVRPSPPLPFPSRPAKHHSSNASH